jgi:hypothetical protein
MTSKISDAACLTLTFDREAVPKEFPPDAAVKEHQWFRDTVIHLCSFLHAVALATLRTDYNMENLEVRAMCITIRRPACLFQLCSPYRLFDSRV